MSKITFITPTGTTKRTIAQHRTPGIAKRCTHRDSKTQNPCLKPQQHEGGHSYKISPAHAAKAAAPKQKVHVSVLVKLDCLAMVEDPAYRRQLLKDLRARKLRPAVECMLWYYAKGKPKEMIEHSGVLSLQQELSALTPEELKARALSIVRSLSTPAITVH